MIWIKTEAGRAELKTHALVGRAATRNLLMVIDGFKSEEMLLKYSVGVTAKDFRLLHQLGLIEPVGGPVPSATAAGRDAAVTPPSTVSDSVVASANAMRFASVLSGLVSTHLGLAGLGVRASIDKALTMDELRSIAHQVLAQIRARKGEQVARDAQKTLFG